MKIKTILSYLTVLSALFLLSACTIAHDRKHINLTDQKIESIESIAILPLDVLVDQKAFGSDEDKRLPEREKEIVTIATNIIKQEFTKQGFSIITIDELPENTKFEYSQLLEKVTTEVSEMYEKRLSNEEKYQINNSVDDLINPLANATNTDYLLVTNMKWIERTTGEMAKDIAIQSVAIVATALLLGSVPQGQQGPPKKEGQIIMALVDGNSGDILWAKQRSYRVSAESSIEHFLKQYIPSKIQ